MERQIARRVKRKAVDRTDKISNCFQSLKRIRHVFKFRLPNGYRQFSIRTSMHAFAELYQAKSRIVKSVWVLLIGVALGFSVFQIYQATDQYINQSLLTSIELAKKENVLYPPLKLCFNHWIQWIDINKTGPSGYTPSALLYGLSSMFEIYSEEFDIVKARNEFNKAQKKNNISNFVEFFKFIAKPLESILFVYTKDEDRRFSQTQLLFHEVFDEITIEKNRLCYKATGEKLKEIIEPNQNDLMLSNFNVLVIKLRQAAFVKQSILYLINSPLINSSQITYPLTPLEHAWNIINWFVHTSSDGGVAVETYKPRSADFLLLNGSKNFESIKDPLNYARIGIPISLYVNAYAESPIQLLADVDTYQIAVKSSSNHWMSTNSRPCVEGRSHISPNTTCQDKCIERNIREDYPSLINVYVKNGLIDVKSSMIEIQFIGKNNNTIRNKKPKSTKSKNKKPSSKIKKVTKPVKRVQRDTPFKKDQQMFRINETMVKRCEQECAGQNGCEIWSYVVVATPSMLYSSVSDVMHPPNPKVVIQYPQVDDILIVIEIPKQSWDSFVGNVGGIIGVWTGASVLSLVQLFYLCFCATEPITD